MPDLNHSVTRTHGFEPLTVEGEIPEGLRGTAYRTGPGLLERFGRPVSHSFVADGAITSVRFGADGVTGACRIVESPEYREEERVGRFLYGPMASRTRNIAQTLTGRAKSTGNTNLLSWQGRLLALVENAKPAEIDPDTIETIGTTNLNVIRAAFSAHPHRVESLETTFNFGMRGRSVDLYALPDEGASRWIGSFDLPWVSMVHDFIATDRHLVFVVGPAKLVAWRAMLAIGDLSKYFRWDARSGAIIVVVPLAEPERAVQFEVDAFWVWHFANAFEDGERIVVDLCRHDDSGALAALSSADPQHGRPALYRFMLDPVRRRFSGEPLWNSPSEFPSVHRLKVGGRHRYIWLQTFPSKSQHPGVARVDCESGKVVSWGAPMEDMGSEPMFVPRDTGETAGWVLQLFQNPATSRSYLVVLDADRLTDGPVARVWFKQPIPMTFHGIFVPSVQAGAEAPAC